jgi:hypothetical protein
MSRSLIHGLLSLLLLFSQQLSLSHGYTHWSEVRQSLVGETRAGERDDKTRLPKPALHDLCGQCAASAQVAFALPTPIRRFVPAELAFAAPRLRPTPGICLLAACPFQPRGPPRA